MAGLWFYARPGSQEKKGPVSEDELRRLIATGEVTGEFMAWTEGMANWCVLNSLPQWPSLAGGTIPVMIPPLAPPPSMAGWMTFVGIVNIVIGILSLLTCFGAISGILMLICGTALLGARAALGATPPDWSTFLAKLNTFIQMTGVMYVLAILSFIIGLVFFFSTLANALSQAMN